MNIRSKSLIATALFLLLQLFTMTSYAASVMGYWKTIDDITGAEKSIVILHGSANNLSGTVVKLFPAALKICTACPGRLKDKPILGMTVIQGLKQDRSNPNVWSGGTVLDPKTGKEYRCTVTVSDDDKTLNVRGYVGISLFGRSQTWDRVPRK